METITTSDCIARNTRLISFDSADMSFPLEERAGTTSRRTHRAKHPSVIGALPHILSSERPNGRRILNSVKPRGGTLTRNYSLPVMVQSDLHWPGAVSRRTQRAKTSSLVSMLFGQKREGTFMTIHGNALFGQAEQPSTNAREDADDLNPAVGQDSLTERYKNPTNEELGLTVAQSDNQETTTTSQQSVGKVSTSSDLANPVEIFTSVKTMDRFFLDDALETDIIVETAKHAFRQTVKHGFNDTNKSEASSSCGDLEAIGFASTPVKSGPLVREMMADSKVFGSGRTYREKRSSDVNPPLSDDDDEGVQPRLPDSRRSVSGRGFQIGHHISPETLDKPRRFLRRKSSKTVYTEKPKTPKKQNNKPNRLRFFIECFGGRVLNEDEDTPSVFQGKGPDSNILPSRRVTDDKKGQTHRYTRRQAFIRTMMESHLDNHQN